MNFFFLTSITQRGMMSLLSSLAVRSSFARTPRPATPQACSDTSKTACRPCVASLHWLDVGHMIPSKTLEAVERRTGHRNSVDSGFEPSVDGHIML